MAPAPRATTKAAAAPPLDRDDDTHPLTDARRAAPAPSGTVPAPLRRVLVTGGCSWAGLALAAALRAAGAGHVLLFDRLPPLAPLAPGIDWCQGREAADPQLLSEALAVFGRVDCVVHLGAAAAGALGSSGGDAAAARRRIVEVGDERKGVG
jgi:hypothetical protein